MRVMVTGTDARAHAMGWKMATEAMEAGAETLDALYFVPGNGGTCDVGENVPGDPTDVGGMVRFARENHVDLTVASPEAHIAAGLGDAFREAGLGIVCPTIGAGRIETRKDWAKDLMVQRGIPTATHRAFSDPDEARAYVRANSPPWFTKAAGLAEGKGSLETRTVEAAEEAIHTLMEEGAFGGAGSTVVIEEHLGDFDVAPELGIHVAAKGRQRRLFPAAQDHKHIGAGHKGKMTGGMGVVSPLPGVTDVVLEDWTQQTVDPALDELVRRGTPFEGILFAGIKVVRGASGLLIPKVLEYNARSGAPETEVYVRRMKSSWLKLMVAIHDGTLDQVDLSFSEEAAATVIMASGGYPGKYEKGLTIEGVEEANQRPGVVVFQAGTEKDGDVLKTAGGRVLSVSGRGPNLETALARAYAAAEVIQFPGKYVRPDIGRSAMRGVFAA